MTDWRGLWRTAWCKITVVVLLGIISLVTVLLLQQEQKPEDELETMGEDSLDDPTAQDIEAEPEENRRQVVELESGTVIILQLQAGQGSTLLHLRLEEVPSLKIYEGQPGDDNVRRQKEKLDQLLKEIFLIDEEGREYYFEDGSYMISHTASGGSPGEATWSSEVYLELPPLKEPGSKLILAIPLSEETETRLGVSDYLLID
ncbi:MAG: hypothetical protein SVV67_09940 [Bacillota bacterium]|nr:hypothetical protein [Bacillota bacterium]